MFFFAMECTLSTNLFGINIHTKQKYVPSQNVIRVTYGQRSAHDNTSYMKFYDRLIGSKWHTFFYGWWQYIELTIESQAVWENSCLEIFSSGVKCRRSD